MFNGTVWKKCPLSTPLPQAEGGTGATTAPTSFPGFGTTSGVAAQGGVIAAGGPTGSASVVPVITYNAAGQLTTVTTATITPAAIGAAATNASTTGTSGGVAATAGTANSVVLANATSGTITIQATTGALGSVTLTAPATTGTLALTSQIPAATTMANCLAGLNPLPCLAYKVAPTLYSGTSGVTLPSVTFATAGVYRFCSFVRVTAVGTAGTCETVISNIQSDGTNLQGYIPYSVNATVLGSEADFCDNLYVDAQTWGSWFLYLPGVTGTPTFRYWATIERMQ
jgi:hypothetical protein